MRVYEHGGLWSGVRQQQNAPRDAVGGQLAGVGRLAQAANIQLSSERRASSYS